ncbi:MAG: serine/threonine protein kinase [Planctomycetota bacterium]|nr:MAG: serine/threonine protein kinase [Planctomycetota bacterium]
MNEHSMPEPVDPTADASFAILEMVLDAARALVPSDTAEALVQLVPRVEPSSQRLIAAELIKFDLHAAVRQGAARRLEFYWPAFAPYLPADQIPYDLLITEHELRRSAGEEVDWAEYRSRFPDVAGLTAELKGQPHGQALESDGGPRLTVGEQIDDFLLLKLLGQGAFARVYLARQLTMQRLVALKVSQRGSVEPQALSRLDHPNIVRVFDQRIHSTPPLYLLYMEFVPGGTLARCLQALRQHPRSLWSGAHLLRSIDQCLLEAQQAVPEYSSMRSVVQDLPWPETVAWIGIQLAEALDYAHRQGVLHRDVKPANVLLSSEGAPKLVDFNVSSRSTEGEEATYFGGSLAYASPEQLNLALDPLADTSSSSHSAGGRLGPTSDLFSLGVLLWELWQGERPWQVRSIPQDWSQAVRVQLQSRRQPLVPRYPAEAASEHALEKALQYLLQFDPERRPQSGGEAAARLRLAFHPELARRFSPSRTSIGGRVLHWPVWIVAAIFIFLPNVIASRFNYVYNEQRIANEYCRPVSDRAPGTASQRDLPGGPIHPTERTSSNVTSPPTTGTNPPYDPAADQGAGQWAKTCPMLEFFYPLARCVNWIVFPVGIALFFWVILPLESAVSMGRRGQRAPPQRIDGLWNVGIRSAALCAVLWTISGAVFAGAMAWRFPGQFGWADAFHFFISLCLCGGVASVYSYFGMSVYSLLVCYPVVVQPTMQDDAFDARCAQQRHRNLLFLVAAAIIPLAAIGMLMFRQTSDVQSIKSLVLLGVMVTGAGLTVAFTAYQKLNRVLYDYALVLGSSAPEVASSHRPRQPLPLPPG